MKPSSHEASESGKVVEPPLISSGRSDPRCELETLCF